MRYSHLLSNRFIINLVLFLICSEVTGCAACAEMSCSQRSSTTVRMKEDLENMPRHTDWLSPTREWVISSAALRF